jgi:hypothetical protein
MTCNALNHVWSNSGTEGMRLTSTGLGIGTSSPAYKLEVAVGTSGSQSIANFRTASSTATDNAGVLFFGTASATATTRETSVVWDADGANSSGSDNFFIRKYGNSGAVELFQVSNAAMLFYTNSAERARIDSSGNLLVATTTVIDSARMTIKGSATVINAQTETNGSYALRVANAAGSGVGGVVANESSTSYLTSSDYRLKNTIVPITGALAKVALLKPCTYKWNANGSEGEGFIAHELAEVCPDAVSGQKDAMDEEGNPQYQGIDVSFLVATLTAAIQEQQALVQSLKARLDAANL